MIHENDHRSAIHLPAITFMPKYTHAYSVDVQKNYVQGLEKRVAWQQWTRETPLHDWGSVVYT